MGGKVQTVIFGMVITQKSSGSLPQMSITNNIFLWSNHVKLTFLVSFLFKIILTSFDSLKNATVKERDYTGVGLYTELQINHNAPKLSKSSRYIEEVPKVHLDHPQLSAGAGAMLWITDGLISTLECYAYGEQWPKEESKFTIRV